MQLKRVWYSLSFILLILFNGLVSAHTFKPSNASVDLLVDDQFSFTIEIDLIELMRWQLVLSSNSANKTMNSGDQLIAQVRSLSKIELYKALKALKLKLQQQIVFYFDDKSVRLEQFYAPNVIDVARLLAQNPNNTNYRVSFSGLGTRPSKAAKLSLFFPEQLGPINFQLATPSRALLSSGVKSEPFLLTQTNISDFTLQLSNSLNYIYQGIIHIIPKGLDHILFVLALFLLSTKLSILLCPVWVRVPPPAQI